MPLPTGAQHWAAHSLLAGWLALEQLAEGSGWWLCTLSMGVTQQPVDCTAELAPDVLAHAWRIRLGHLSCPAALPPSCLQLMLPSFLPLPQRALLV